MGPVLSKPLVLRGIIPSDGSPGRSDLSLGDQLRQRAAMGGERERAELAAFEAVMANGLLTLWWRNCETKPPLTGLTFGRGSHGRVRTERSEANDAARMRSPRGPVCSV
jgi:hypothetical protein